jgi:hypothetical protein
VGLSVSWLPNAMWQTTYMNPVTMAIRTLVYRSFRTSVESHGGIVVRQKQDSKERLIRLQTSWCTQLDSKSLDSGEIRLNTPWKSGLSRAPYIVLCSHEGDSGILQTC